MPEPTALPAAIPDEPAEIGRTGELLARLAPALDAYQVAHDAPSFRAYVPGSIPSEAHGLPEQGIAPEAVVDELALVVEQGSRISAPGWLSFITTGASTVPAVAATAVAVAGGQRYLLQAFNALEYTGLRWLADLCGLPADATGVFSSGGSTAQLVGLGTARQAIYERLGVDVAQQGAPAAPQGRIYASVAAHRTVHRSAAVLGLGRDAVAEIPVDRDGRIRVDELESALARDTADGILPIAVVAIAGVTDTGSVDRIDRVVEVGRRFGCWVHVDGAYGLIANASPARRALFAGVEEADSWIVDPHKWLATGVGVGATYVRDGDVLTRAFAEGDAAYLEGAFGDEDAEPASQFETMGGAWADQGVELSAPPRGVLVWAALRELGRSGVAARVERHIAFAREVADRALAHPRLELLLDPQLSITCFRYRPTGGAGDPAAIDALNRQILARLRASTPLVPSSTLVDGALAIRPCFINPRTTGAEVDALVDAVIRIGDELAGA